MSNQDSGPASSAPKPNKGRIACVTGGRGMVGSRIVRRLLADGYAVRVLSRSEGAAIDQAEVFHGDIVDSDALDRFLAGADMLFHCAAELRNEDRMWEVNVEGTRTLARAAEKAGIEYFCHLSSAGVIGLTDRLHVDESCECNPQNAYERSKWEAEKIVARGIHGCRIVMLRPTNVVDDRNPGFLNGVIRGGAKARLKVLLQGRECTHLVHSEDVAEAAVYLASQAFDRPECFFVSCDDDPLNCFAGAWAVCRAWGRDAESPGEPRLPWSAPVWLPHLIRTALQGRSNRGDVRYSSKKLLSTGFNLSHGFRGALRRMMSSAEGKA